MGRYTKLISIFTLSLMVLSLTIVASAQWRDRRGNDDYYGRNTGNLKSTIRSLEGNTRIFQEQLDRELDRSRYDGTNREDNLNRLAKRLRDAADDLDDEYDNQRDYRNTSDEVRRVINYGTQLDRALSNSRITRNNYQLRNTWRNIETDLGHLSRAYNIRYDGTYGRNGRYGRNDDDRYERNRRNRRGNNRGRNNRNGRYGNSNLRSTIVNLKYKSARFEDRLDRERDNRYGRRVSGNLENLSNRFNDAVKDLEDEYDNNRDYNDSYDEVRRVLSIGEQLDREISRSGVDRSIRNNWNNIENDLRIIARAYNVNYNGTNRGRVGIGDIIRNFPF